jgi:hypothetical protein
MGGSTLIEQNVLTEVSGKEVDCTTRESRRPFWPSPRNEPTAQSSSEEQTSTRCATRPSTGALRVT